MKQSRHFFSALLIRDGYQLSDIKKIQKNPPTAFFCSGEIVYYYVSKEKNTTYESF